MNKKNIYFKADEQLLTNITPNCFASDTVAYIEAHFDLGENWSGFDSVRAVWTNGAAVISSVLYDGACIVPWEVLTKRAEVKVNLVGSNVENGELIDRLTTCQVPALNIKCKALIEGSNTATPTPSEYEQFVQNVHEDAERAEAARDEAEQILTDTEQIKTDVENLKTQTLAIKVETESIKGDVETLKSQTEDLVDGFNDEVEEALDRISAKEDDVLYDINSAKTSALGEINDKETLALAEIVNAKSSALTDISSARVTTLNEIQTEGTTQKNLVTTEGQTQVANVQTEGETQIQAIEDKGTEVIASIPNFAPVITDTANGSIASFSDGADDYPMKSVVAQIVPIQEGSGDPSPTNVRPISGWSGVNVWNDPKYGGLINFNQLFKFPYNTMTDKGLNLTKTGGVLTLTGTPTGSGNTFGTGVKNVQNHIYYIRGNSVPNKLNFSSQSFGADNGNGCIIKNPSTSSTWYYTINIPSNLVGTNIGTVTMQPMVIDLTQLFGETKANEIYAMSQTDAVAYFKSLFYKEYYEYNTGEITTVSAVNGDPYEAYSIPFKDENGNPITVYGGVLDVVSGALTITHGRIDLGSLNYGKTTSYAIPVFYKGLAGAKIGVENVKPNAYCEIFDIGRSDSALGLASQGNNLITIATGTNQLLISYETDMSASDFKAFVTGKYFVYPLATPTEIQLTPTQVKTLLGNNNIFADSGSVEVEYRADTKLYIDKKING